MKKKMTLLGNNEVTTLAILTKKDWIVLYFFICPTFSQVDLDMTTQPRPEGRTSLTGTRGSPSTLASVRGWTKSHMEWVAGQGVQGI